MAVVGEIITTYWFIVLTVRVDIDLHWGMYCIRYLDRFSYIIDADLVRRKITHGVV